MEKAVQEENKDVSFYLQRFPISEVFTNFQGEGFYAGTMMTFIRLAGCNVGKRYTKEMYDTTRLPVYTEKCTTYDGREFPCDTDYRKHFSMTIEDIEVGGDVQHVCITGGEPCIHSFLYNFILHFQNVGKEVHLETSGTKEINVPGGTWVTVAPKLGVKKSSIARANEIKLLVDEHFDPAKLYYLEETSIDWRFLAQQVPIYLQPVNGEHTVSAANQKRCVDIAKRYPSFRVGQQMHKAIELIVGEHQR